MLPRTCAPLLCGYYETKAILATLSANGVCQGERSPMRDTWTKCDNDCKQTIQKGMADFGCCYTKVYCSSACLAFFTHCAAHAQHTWSHCVPLRAAVCVQCVTISVHSIRNAAAEFACLPKRA